MYDIHIKRIQEMQANMDRMLAPYKNIQKTIARQEEIKNRMIKSTQPPVLNQIKQIQNKIDSINAIKNRGLELSKYIESYNQTKTLLNNLSDSEDKTSTVELRELKNEFRTMPDIESSIESLNDTQREEVRKIFYEVVSEASKGEEASDDRLGKLSKSVTLFVTVPEIPEAIEKYSSILIVLYKFFT